MATLGPAIRSSNWRRRNSMRDDHDDELVWQTSQEKADAVSHLFRRRPHNLIEKIEKLGFTYRVDDSEDAEDIAEERAARPKTTAQTVLVYYLDGADTPTESLLALWREETQRNNTPFPLWRRYFRAGNAQLKKLILFGLDRDATDRDLLDSLSFLHSFLPMPKELLTRYKLACDQESDPQRFRELAQDFDASTSSFGYDALQALQAHYADCAVRNRSSRGCLSRSKSTKTPWPSELEFGLKTGSSRAVLSDRRTCDRSKCTKIPPKSGMAWQSAAFSNGLLELCSDRAIDCAIIKPVGSLNSFRGYPKEIICALKFLI